MRIHLVENFHYCIKTNLFVVNICGWYIYFTCNLRENQTFTIVVKAALMISHILYNMSFYRCMHILA